MKIPEAVMNLKLCWAFRSYKQKVIDCIEVTEEKEFYIYDDEKQKCIIISSDSNRDKACKVINSSGNEVVVLAIDHKLIDNRKGGIADGAVFNMSDFHFVEFKTNAVCQSVISVDETYTKAMDQLISSINLFTTTLNKEKIDFMKKVNVECHIIVSTVFPRNNAVEMTKSLLFAQQTNGIPLSFENEIILI